MLDWIAFLIFFKKYMWFRNYARIGGKDPNKIKFSWKYMLFILPQPKKDDSFVRVKHSRPVYKEGSKPWQVKKE
jgi:hypothetical protein